MAGAGSSSRPPAFIQRSSAPPLIAPAQARSRTFDAEAIHLQRARAALPPSRAAARDHPGVLLLAGVPGHQAVLSSRGRVRSQHRLRVVRELQGAAEPAGLLSI